MTLNRWLFCIVMIGLIWAINPWDAQARPHFGDHPGYHHPRGKAYGWHGSRHHGFDRHYKHFGHHWKGPRHSRHYVHQAGPPSVVYVQPVTPIVGIPQPQPYYSQPAPPGLSGQFNFPFNIPF